MEANPFNTTIDDKLVNRVLIEMRNVLRSQILRFKSVVIPYAGKFQIKEENSFRFIPTIEFLTSGPYKLIEDEFNVGPLSRKSAKFQSSPKLSLSQISKQSAVNIETCIEIIKGAFSKFQR